MPTTEKEWLAIAEDFNKKWNFPNCIGALDGKHVNIRAPKNLGSLYFNYKLSHSIVLMALVDANYKFIHINVGSRGRNADGGTFNNTLLAKSIELNTAGIPKDKPLPQRKNPMPFVIIADDAFAMKKYLLKPYSFHNQTLEERVFNYRLSRARRIVENAFGIASARFRSLRRIFELEPKKVSIIVSAICVLHNFLMSRSQNTYAPNGTFDFENTETGIINPGYWRHELENEKLTPIEVTKSKNCEMSIKEIRNEFKNYFNQQGAVPWQFSAI